MAHFAKLDDNNKVIQVIVVGNNDILDSESNESEAVGLAFCTRLFGGRWIQTSYNGSFRGKFANPGDIYDSEQDVFVQGTPPDPEPGPPAAPNYTVFWERLMGSSLYASIREQSMVSLAMNTLGTEFIALLGDAKDGRPYVTAIQQSMGAILQTGTFTEEQLVELQAVLVAANLDSIYTLP